MRSTTLGFLIVTLALACSAASHARTWYVTENGTGDAPTIQAGIDSASALDTVLVAPGTYYEHDIVMKSGVCVHGEQGAESTVINGQDLGRIFNCDTLMSPFTEISGLTISWGDESSGFGGGIRCYGGEITIKDNIIYACSSRRGGGIYLWDCGATVVGNEIRECWGRETGDGAGIFCSASFPLIVSNHIWGCGIGIRGVGCGGAICLGAESAFVSGNRIGGNWAGEGGGLWLSGTGEVSWNAIHENSVWADEDLYPDEALLGGGIYAYGDMLISHNTIVSNWAYDDYECGGYGGGLFVYPSVRLENNIVGWNHGLTDGGGIFCSNGCPVLMCNDFYSNFPQNYAGACSDLTGIDGNISEDPLFCDSPNRDYSLHCSSPCLNAAGCDSMGALGEGCGDCTTALQERVVVGAVPAEPVLVGNHPNPFNPTTTIVFGLPEMQRIRIDVYDARGRLVRELLEGQLDAGFSIAAWDGRNQSGTMVAPGVYFARMEVGGKVQSRKMVLVK